MRFRFFFAFWICLSFFTPLQASSQDEVQPLWDELSARWSANDSAGAEAVAGKLIEALTPVATDFSLGIQMNSALHNRASLRYNIGDYAGAEADLLASVEQARAIQAPAGLPPQSIPAMMAMVDDRVRLSLRGLVNFYLAAGDLKRATAAFDEAIAIVPLWKKQSQDTPAMGYQILAAEISSMEGTFYRTTGDFTKAAAAFVTRLEEIDGAWEMVLKMQGGAESDFTDQLKMNYLRGRANVLMELAEIASLQEKHIEAGGFCKQARESSIEMMPLYRKWAETMQRTNPAMPKETIAKTLQGVEINSNYLVFERSALVFRAGGEERAALDLMLEGGRLRGENFEQQRMLTLEYNVIRPEESLKLIGDLRAILGEHEEAAVAYGKAITLTKSQYPGEHPAVLDIEESRALLAQKVGDPAAAAAIARGVRESRLKNLTDVLSFADEAQRLAYRSSIDPWSLFASLGLTEELATTVLQTKGIVLESLLEDRGIAERNNDPALAEKLEKLKVSRRRLMELLLGGAEAGSEDMGALRRAIDELEAGLSGPASGLGGARGAIEATTERVATALPPGGVLIDYIRYRDYTAPGRFTPRYGAVIFKAGTPPAFVPLETAARIEEMMDLYASAVRSEVPDEAMAKFLASLGASVWAPLTTHLPAAGAPVILCPDGALNFLSFATLLMPDGRFVGENWSLSYVSSGRDLLREAPATRENSIEIMANPDFQAPGSGALAGERSRGVSAAVAMRGVLDRIGLSPLPGTKAEEAALRELPTREWQWSITSHLEREATEAAVNAVKSPGVLHLATHGFFLPQTGRTDPLERLRGYWETGAQAGG